MQPNLLSLISNSHGGEGMRLDGEIVLLTGTSCEIAESIASAFAASGANLVFIARQPGEAQRIATIVAARGAKSFVFPGDPCSRSDLRAMALAAMETFGKIDVLINAAGIYGLLGARPGHSDERAAILDAHPMGTVFAVKAVLPYMLARRRGVIINFCGPGIARPFPRFSPRGASNAAVARFTEATSDLVTASGIRINTIALSAWNRYPPDPSQQSTLSNEIVSSPQYLNEMVERLEPPECAAELALFLAGEPGKGITGRLISANVGDWWNPPESREPGRVAFTF